MPAMPNITPDMIVNGGPGLTKREYAAIHILAGIMANRPLQEVLSEERKSYASIAAHEADNLFIELDKEKE